MRGSGRSGKSQAYTPGSPRVYTKRTACPAAAISPAVGAAAGRVPPEKLIIHQTLSRELEAYRSPSPTTLAARQLAEHDKNLRPGQVVRFVYTLGKPGVWAWDVPGELDGRIIDVARYSTLLERAAETIFQPFLSDGIDARLPLLADLYIPKKVSVQ